MSYGEKQIVDLFFSGLTKKQIAKLIKERDKITKTKAEQEVEIILYNYYKLNGFE